jgi:hypothetical protein
MRGDPLVYLGLLLVGAMSIATDVGAAQIATPSEQQCQEGSIPSFACVEQLEGRLLRSRGEVFVREGNELLLRSATDKTLRLVDSTESGSESPAVYRALHYWPEVRWALVIHLACSGECIRLQLIDLRDQPRSFDVEGWAMLSPNRMRFASFNSDIAAGFSANGIGIYRIQADGLTTEYQSKDDSWGVKSAQWTSDSALKLKIEQWCESPVQLCEGDQTLSLVESQWRLNIRPSSRQSRK